MIRYALWGAALLFASLALFGIYSSQAHRSAMLDAELGETTDTDVMADLEKESALAERTVSKVVMDSTSLLEKNTPLHAAPTPSNTPEQVKNQFVELVTPSAFINSGPFTIGEYVGKKVILLTFITYSCINCQNTFSFLRDMQARYGDKGLQILAIHTPEFAYEKVTANVDAAMKKNGLTFPVALDNEYQTWNAYDNHYWPARYIIDQTGTIVYTHAGEGEYEETERIIKNNLGITE
jgi:peroxiredoxin